MAIELHHLHPGHDDELSRLKTRIAELEKLNHDMCERVTENDEIRLHWEEIEQTKAENERMKARIAELEKENESLKYSVATLETDLAMATRWRKCSEELPVKRQFVLARFADRLAGHYPIDVIQWDVSYSRNHNGVQVTHWMPLPSAPKEEK